MIGVLAVGVITASVLSLILLISSATTQAVSSPVSVKGDRLDARPFGAACSQTTWPHYEAHCLRNMVTPVRTTQKVRVVTPEHRARMIEVR